MMLETSARSGSAQPPSPRRAFVPGRSFLFPAEISAKGCKAGDSGVVAPSSRLDYRLLKHRLFSTHVESSISSFSSISFHYLYVFP